MPELEILEQNKQRLRSLKEMLHQYSAPAAEALIDARARTARSSASPAATAA